MTPSQSGRATPTPHRMETGRSQWDYTASPAPSPARAGTGTGNRLPHKGRPKTRLHKVLNSVDMLCTTGGSASLCKRKEGWSGA